MDIDDFVEKMKRIQQILIEFLEDDDQETRRK